MINKSTNQIHTVRCCPNAVAYLDVFLPSKQAIEVTQLSNDTDIDSYCNQEKNKTVATSMQNWNDLSFGLSICNHKTKQISMFHMNSDKLRLFQLS